MLDLVAVGPKTVGEIAAKFKKLSRFAVMQRSGRAGRCEADHCGGEGKREAELFERGADSGDLRPLDQSILPGFSSHRIGSALKHFAEGESDG